MITAKRFRPYLIGLGMAAALAANPARAVTVLPNPATAGAPFTLYLQGVAGLDCYSTFSRESVTVSGDNINLRYTVTSLAVPVAASANPAPGAMPVVCAMPAADAMPVYTGGMPAFAMPALNAGTYHVYATPMPECLYAAQPCEVPIMSQDAGILKVEAAPVPAFFINPSTALPNQAFQLQLLSYDFSCASIYDSLSAVVADGVITLSFLERLNPAALCAAVATPYGPTFRIPALKEGSYKVKANRLSGKGPVDAGTLTIAAGVPRKSWYLKEKQTLAGKAFAMQLLRDDIGNCQTSFADENIQVSSQSIALGFTMEQHPDRVCVQNIQPFGPTFEMPSLKTGTYPVFVSVCVGLAGQCKGASTASVVDTLIVMQTLSARISGLRGAGPKVELRGQAAVFALPEGKPGFWRAELMTLDGRVLGRTTVAGPAGQRVSVPVGRAPANAVSLLRLTSPDGGQRFLPIVR